MSQEEKTEEKSSFNLPSELVTSIFEFKKFEELIVLSKVCKQFLACCRQIYKTKYMWSLLPFYPAEEDEKLCRMLKYRADFGQNIYQDAAKLTRFQLPLAKLDVNSYNTSFKKFMANSVSKVFYAYLCDDGDKEDADHFEFIKDPLFQTTPVQFLFVCNQGQQKVQDFLNMYLLQWKDEAKQPEVRWQPHINAPKGWDDDDDDDEKLNEKKAAMKKEEEEKAVNVKLHYKKTRNALQAVKIELNADNWKSVSIPPADAINVHRGLIYFQLWLNCFEDASLTDDQLETCLDSYEQICRLCMHEQLVFLQLVLVVDKELSRSIALPLHRDTNRIEFLRVCSVNYSNRISFMGFEEMRALRIAYITFDEVEKCNHDYTHWLQFIDQLIGLKLQLGAPIKVFLFDFCFHKNDQLTQSLESQVNGFVSKMKETIAKQALEEDAKDGGSGGKKVGKFKNVDFCVEQEFKLDIALGDLHKLQEEQKDADMCNVFLHFDHVDKEGAAQMQKAWESFFHTLLDIYSGTAPKGLTFKVHFYYKDYEYIKMYNGIYFDHVMQYSTSRNYINFLSKEITFKNGYKYN